MHANTIAAKWVPECVGWLQPMPLTLERMQECWNTTKRNVVSDMSSLLPTLSLRLDDFWFPTRRIQLLCSSIHDALAVYCTATARMWSIKYDTIL